jgi:hypothetical protein
MSGLAHRTSAPFFLKACNAAGHSRIRAHKLSRARPASLKWPSVYVPEARSKKGAVRASGRPSETCISLTSFAAAASRNGFVSSETPDIPLQPRRIRRRRGLAFAGEDEKKPLRLPAHK